jgi:hypothetical protein
MNNIILLQSEAYDQLQRTTFAYMRKLMAEERQKPVIEWLDNDAVAAMLKVSKRTLQSWRDERLLKFSQVGRQIYYNREDIDQMLQKHCHKPFKAAKGFC